jgi:hypothetical protein
MLFAGDAFIIQVMGVFTRIRLGATREGRLWWQANVDLIYLAAAAVAEEQRGSDFISNLKGKQTLAVKNPKGVTCYL